MDKAKLREAMKKRNMNMADVANASEVAPAILSRVLNSQRTCYVDTAAKIRKGMKLSQKETIEIFFGE